jgi:hypothetical protein
LRHASFEYSVAINVMARLAEVTGQPLDKFIYSWILGPLAMVDPIGRTGKGEGSEPVRGAYASCDAAALS